MKKTVTIVLAITTLMVSCKDDKDKKKVDNNESEEVFLQEEEVTDKLPNPSDISFVAAFEEYQDGNYDKAADYIENGVIELREEEKATEKLDGLLLDKEIEKIRSIEEKVRTNKIEDINILAQAIGNAEMLIAHDYIVYTVSTFLEEPVKGAYYFSKALRSLNNATLKLEGTAKEEAKEIRDESKQLAGKIQSGDKDLEKNLNKQTKKIEDFLKKHKTDLL